MGRVCRADQFQASEICLVNVVQRCVRRAFLTGHDPVTGRDFSARRERIRRRMEMLASVFGIDVLNYSLLSNHMHLLLRNRPDVVARWTDEQVAIRWLRVFPGKRLEEHLAEPSEADVQALVGQTERMVLIRQRLSDPSWFMRTLSESIARSANREDNCTGRFWEGRFKATRIIDEAGLLACAAYIDLNPLRAALVAGLEEESQTSACDRHRAAQGQLIDSAAFDLVVPTAQQVAKEIRETPVEQLKAKRQAKRQHPTNRRVKRDGWLARLTLNRDVLAADPQVHSDGLRASDKGFLDLDWASYWKLLGWAAQQGKSVVSEQMPQALTKCLEKLGIQVSMWHHLVLNFEDYFGSGQCIGSPAALAEHAQRTGKRWHRGQGKVRSCFATAASPPPLPPPAVAGG